VARATGWKVWNPGEYGDAWHQVFRSVCPPRRGSVLIFGLNPGPYGMAQTGIPFTDVRRLREFLPRVSARLAALRPDAALPEVPGLAPRDLQPFLTRTFESSSVRMYRFLARVDADVEQACRRVVVANPCPLLFVDKEEGRNRTPADLRREVRRNGRDEPVAMQQEMDRLRRENCEDALRTLRPKAVVLLGRDAQAALRETVVGRLGEDRVLDWEHPARAVPDPWARGLQEALQNQGALPMTRR
jgi:single-strand selective monofunctional uracil DNA glycosylase